MVEFVALASILLSWAILALTFLGIGAGVTGRRAQDRFDLDDLFLRFWVGFGLTLVILQLWHCIFRIDIRVLLIVLLLGLFGHLFTRGTALRSLFALIRTSGPGLILLLAVPTVWLANRATGPQDNYDSGNYHFQVIRWVTTAPVVKGIGNIDGHLGFNNAQLLYQGMLEVGFWQHRSAHIGNGLLLLAMLLFCLFKLYQVVAGRLLEPANLFAAAILTALIDLAFGVSTPNTDLPTICLMFVIGYFLLLACPFGARKSRVRVAQTPFSVCACMFLCSIAITVKLSAAVYSVMACLSFAALWLLTSREYAVRYRIRVAAGGAALFAAVLLLWSTRSVLMTGYPLFPSLILPMPVPWRIPQFYAAWYQWWITTFARSPYDDTVPTQGLDWVRHWLFIELRGAKIAGLLPLFLAGISLPFVVASRRGRDLLNVFLPAWAAGVIAFSAWLASAPGFRFGEGILWMLAAQGLALSIMTLAHKSGRARYAVYALLVLPVSAFAIQPVLMRAYEHLSTAAAIRKTLWIVPGPDRGMYPVHVTPVIGIRTAGGVYAYEPRVRPPCPSDEWKDCVMWYGPLPSAQRLKDSLQYLSMADPSQGFAIKQTPAEWLKQNSAMVQQKAKDRNLRQLAFDFQVPPEMIERALSDTSGASNTSKVQPVNWEIEK